MTICHAKQVLIYGANGYTGKIVSEALARRGIGHYFAGRNQPRLEAAIKVVEERLGRSFDVELAVASNNPEALRPFFEQVDVVINVAGPFMQMGWPIVETALECGCHYLDTTGEQDWTIAIAEKYGQAFADKGLLLAPACSYMWTAGALAAEVVLETEGIDSIDLLYQIDNGGPSVASTRSFLRMLCNEQYFLNLNEYQAWPNDTVVPVSVPYRSGIIHAFPWGGGCEPVWFKSDERVRNCSVLTSLGEHMVPVLKNVIAAFNEHAKHLPEAEREAWTNNMGDQISQGEPDKDHPDVCRTVIICGGQGRQITTRYEMSLTTPYCWTGDICAESTERLLNNELKQVGFQSPAKAFGHRELIGRFHDMGYCSALPERQ